MGRQVLVTMFHWYVSCINYYYENYTRSSICS